MEGFRYPCGLCSNFFSRKQNIARHQSTVHEGVGYLCIQCDKQSYWKKNLGEHQRAAHEGVKYPWAMRGKTFSERKSW